CDARGHARQGVLVSSGNPDRRRTRPRHLHLEARAHQARGDRSTAAGCEVKRMVSCETTGGPMRRRSFLGILPGALAVAAAQAPETAAARRPRVPGTLNIRA